MSAETRRIVLILGGARSGKSSFAERLGQQLGEPLLFVATATAGDEEMRSRIEAHQAGRPPEWGLLEATADVGSAIRGTKAEARTILLDCVTMLVSNILVGLEHNPSDRGDSRTQVEGELDAILDAARDRCANLVIVSNEVGLGLVPEYPLGRSYRDLLGYANQRLAAAADDVYFMVAGIPMEVKRPP